MDLVMPDLGAEHLIALEPDDRNTRGAGGAAARPVADALSIGVPIVQAVTPQLAGDDEALAAFVAQQGSEWTYVLVYFGCTFLPVAGSLIASAWFTVTFESDGTSAAAVAWSMAPMRETTTRPVNRALKLNASVGIVHVGMERDDSGQQSTPIIEAFGIQDSTCGWTFNSTDSAKVSGTHRLTLVARRPTTTQARATLSMQATIETRRFGLAKYTSVVPDELGNFTC